MSSKHPITRITASFKDHEKLKTEISQMEDEVTQIRKTRDELLETAGAEITDVVAQEIIDYDEQIVRIENRINKYEFELEKAVTYLESVFNKIGVDKTIRVVSSDKETFNIYRNDKNKFSTEKELKSFF